MNIKHILGVSAGLLLLAGGDAQLLLQAGREEIIRDEMRLTAGEDAAFWPVYDKYQSDLTLVGDFLGIQGNILKIKKKHLKDFRKVLPARKAARFYQLENKMDAELEGQLSLVVPLIVPV